MTAEEQQQMKKKEKKNKQAKEAELPVTEVNEVTVDKEKKKKKRKEQEEVAPASSPAPETVAPEGEKKKKKKNKLQENGVDNGQDSNGHTNGNENGNGSDAASDEKQMKKKQKFVSTEVESSEPATSNGSEEKKKRNKEKKLENEINPEVSAEAMEEEKPKKQKKHQNGVTLEQTEKPKKEKKNDGEIVYKEHPEVSRLTEEDINKFHQDNMISVSGNDAMVRPITQFHQLGIPDHLLACTKSFEKPTPIQSQSWPVLLKGRDVIGIAKTGSGKTLGFGLPGVVHILNKTRTRPVTSSDPGPLLLVLSPTRELALQTAKVFEDMEHSCQVRSVCVYGGGDIQTQTNALRKGVHIIVATPGRLISLIREGQCSLARVSYLVLDEADRMLDMGFEPAIREICDAVPVLGRQTLLFSATWPEAIRKLGAQYVKDPLKVTIGQNDELTANVDVEQIVEVVEDHEKDQKVLGLLSKYHSTRKNRIIIFVLYKKDVGRVEILLNKKGWACAGISSDRGQNERIRALDNFKNGSVPLLIATDVAARGLDIPDVTHVINYSFPLTIEDYVHRIGRTARGGKKGISHTFFTRNDKHLSGELINLLREAGQKIPESLSAFGCFTKKKTHALYGAHFKDDDRPTKAAVRVKF